MMLNETQQSDSCWRCPDLDFQCFVVGQAMEYFLLLHYLKMEDCLDSTLGQYYLWEWN
jgi:hypothetical protein